MPRNRVRRLLSRSLISPLQVRSELECFAKIVKDSGTRKLMEIGRCKGGTLFVLARACQNHSTIISVDLTRLSPIRTRMLRTFAEHPPEARCEVSVFWHEIKSQYKHLEIIEDREQGWAGIGVLYA